MELLDLCVKIRISFFLNLCRTRGIFSKDILKKIVWFFKMSCKWCDLNHLRHIYLQFSEIVPLPGPGIWSSDFCNASQDQNPQPLHSRRVKRHHTCNWYKSNQARGTSERFARKMFNMCCFHLRRWFHFVRESILEEQEGIFVISVKEKRTLRFTYIIPHTLPLFFISQSSSGHLSEWYFKVAIAIDHACAKRANYSTDKIYRHFLSVAYLVVPSHIRLKKHVYP